MHDILKLLYFEHDRTFKPQFLQMLEEKIYSPYFINNSTILKFQRAKKEGKKDEKYSLIDILHIFARDKVESVKYCFQVNMFEEDTHATSLFENNQS